MNLDFLKTSLKEAPIIKRGEYFYVIHPITDGIPEIKSELLKEVTDKMKERIKTYGPIDRIVTMEAMGIPLASVLAMEMNLPFTIIRKREYCLPGEISVEQMTGYSTSHMFINGIKKGEKIVIVDDVLSTGGTLRAILTVLTQMKVTIKGVIIAINKGTSLNKIRNEFNIPIEVLVTIEIRKGKVVIKS
jgi:adenine phosphoribosyltransferase